MQDEKIDIAVGHGARSRVWKNKQWSWGQIVEKLLTENKTNETFKEFITASKEDQLKIKDSGGYVGGYLRGGRRKPENVVHRQLLTLDIDEAHTSFWDDFQMQFDNAAVLHGTHKHSEANPRYRLVLPLSREATPDEYVATARYVAGVLGIDLFDNTTFQCERLMFWPSTPKDQEYYAESQEGAWLDVDQVLSSYTDWTDSSTWPTSESTIREVKNASSKQEDPETKRGVIGAFCRTYSITEVIEKFLGEEYVSAGDGRFTYTKGTAAAGLVLYEDKFAFSHHGTDPSSGKLCNAFDLVRIHRFGHLDTNQTVGGVKAKSFIAMSEFCREDVDVKKTLASEKIAESRYDFAEEFEEPEEEITLDWMSELEVDGKGKYLSSSTNINAIFANDTKLKSAFQENVFDDKKYVIRTLPWRKINKPEPIKNVDYSGVRNYIETIYGISGVTKIEDALNIEFEKHSFHPIKEYFNGLEWDGQKRIDTLLIDYFGADDNVYSREAIRKTLVGAVARVFNPGVKFDLVLTLVGNKQGTGKSTFFAKLGQEWFSDSFHTIKGNAAFEQLQGAWIMEIAELAGLKKADIEPIKHYLTKQEDTYRPAYGRIVETFKRKVIFVSTTNEKDFLRDPSGNRRFMPVDVHEYRMKKKILNKDELVGEQVDQVWAEALALFKGGEPLYLSGEAEKIAHKEQRDHSQVDDRQGLVQDYLDTLLPEDWQDKDIHSRRTFLTDSLSPKGTKHRNYVCIAEIWCECLGKEKHDMNRYNTREINDIMRGLDEWEQVNSTRNFGIYGKQKYYTRKLY